MDACLASLPACAYGIYVGNMLVKETAVECAVAKKTRYCFAGEDY